MSNELYELFFDPKDEQSFHYSEGYIEQANQTKINREHEENYVDDIFLQQYSDFSHYNFKSADEAKTHLSSVSNLNGFKFLKQLKNVLPSLYNEGHEGRDTYGRDRIYLVIRFVYDIFINSRNLQQKQEIKVVEARREAAKEAAIKQRRDEEEAAVAAGLVERDAKKRKPQTLKLTIPYEPYQEHDSEGAPDSKRRREAGGSRRKSKRRRVKSTRGRHRRHNKSTRRRRRKY